MIRSLSYGNAYVLFVMRFASIANGCYSRSRVTVQLKRNGVTCKWRHPPTVLGTCNALKQNNGWLSFAT